MLHFYTYRHELVPMIMEERSKICRLRPKLFTQEKKGHSPVGIHRPHNQNRRRGGRRAGSIEGRGRPIPSSNNLEETDRILSL